jgi:hypothetical protein
MTLSIKALTFDTGGKILDRGLSAAPAAAAGAGRLAAGTGTAPGPVDLAGKWEPVPTAEI